jgi:hypothetical protein
MPSVPLCFLTPEQTEFHGSNRNSRAMIIVGTIAASTSPLGEMPSFPKAGARIDCPAGFGALAITVNPPPVTAPATTAYFKAGVNPGTSEAR